VGWAGFVDWASRHLSSSFTGRRFIVINAIAWPAMLATSLATIYIPAVRWLVVTLAVILLVNGVLHLGSTFITNSYSPGVISGVLVYLPLASLSLRWAVRECTPAMIAVGIGLGVAIHGLVAFVAFGTD
jgi:hypothetical protein